MNKVIRLSLVALAMCWFVRLAGAQSGCVNSPENPTAVLALIGASGYVVPSLMSRLAKKRK
jgi:XrtJ-associated TM-motif-TM protein